MSVSGIKPADYKSILGVIPKEGLAGRHPQIVFWYYYDKSLGVY